jgi:quinol monooxygenase YgiN
LPASRRDVVASTAALALAGLGAGEPGDEKSMSFGLIGSMSAKPGQREALVAAMTAASEPMPGCLSYVVALDRENPDLIWITEVWDSEASHQASLQIPWVKAAIAKAMPLIAGFGQQTKTRPVAGMTPQPGRTMRPPVMGSGTPVVDGSEIGRPRSVRAAR